MFQHYSAYSLFSRLGAGRRILRRKVASTKLQKFE